MRNKYVPPYIAAAFGIPVSVTNNGEYIYHCPKCMERGRSTPDTKGKLYVNPSGVYHCFRCEWSGTLNRSKKSEDLTKVIDTEYDELVSKVKHSINPKSYRSMIKYEIPNIPVIALDYPREYLHHRNISDYQMLKYDLRYSYEKPIANRVVIPNMVLYDKSGVPYTDMYNARSITHSARKYINPEGAKKTEIVFNLHRIPDRVPIIICEGALSAISAGDHACSIYGKAISNTQLSMILKKNPSAIYVCLDPDAIDNAVKLSRRIMNMVSCPVYLIRMPIGTDPNDVGYSNFMRILRSTPRFDPIMSKIYGVVNST